LQLASLITAERPLPRPRVEEIIRRSGGNPLFLLEMVEAASRSGGSGDLPGSIEELITARIDRLDPELRRLLRFSSAFGRNVDVDLVIESLGDDLPEAADPINWSALGDYLEPSEDNIWRFRQNMFRDVAYGSLPFGVRKTLHGRIGTVLEAHSEDPEKDADQLSLHFSLADDHDRAWKYSTLAGDRARNQYANVAAADFYQRAVEAARWMSAVDRIELATVYEALGDVNELAGIFDRADTAYKAARRDVRSDPVATARLMSKQGMLREKAGDLSQALRWLGRGLRLLESPSAGGSEIKAELQIAYAGVRFRQGRFQDCVDWCRRALAGLGEHEGLPQQAHALHLLVTALAHLRRPIDTEGDRALEIYTELGDQVGLGNILTNLGVEAFYRGDWTTALDLYVRSEEARRTAGDVIGAAASANNIAEIYSDQGRVTEAIGLFREALAVWEGAQFLVGIALVNLNLGRADARAGLPDLAQSRLDKAFEMFDEMGAQSYVLDTNVRRTEAYLLNGEFDRARELAESLLHNMVSDEHNQVFEATLYRVLGYCCQAVGDDLGSLNNFEKALRLALEADAAFEAAVTLEGLLRFFGEDGRGTDWQFEEELLFQRLGIIATPVVPLNDVDHTTVSGKGFAFVPNVL
jgi:tetratricopeptide (TPR) repeat protein